RAWRGRYVVEHPEYGPPPDPEEVRVHGARGPGAFCAAPWHPDTRRLGADVNRLFRGIAVSAADVTGDTRALRRALFDFYAMGYTRQRPSAPCWQALLQLSPEQSAPLRSALRELNERDVYDPRVLSPPVIEGPLFGEECDVDEDDAGSDTTVASEFSFRGSAAAATVVVAAGCGGGPCDGGWGRGWGWVWGMGALAAAGCDGGAWVGGAGADGGA
ncbi:hypothetical protein EG871_13365, partial [Enterococcus faecium]